MTNDIERDLLRRLAGELDETAELRLDERLAADPALARRAERLAAAWRAAEPPPAPAVPPGFTGRVMAHVREESRWEETRRGEAGRGALLPTVRLRWAGAAALVAGLVLGGGVGQLAVPGGTASGGGEETIPAAVAAPSAAAGAEDLAASSLLGEEEPVSLADRYLEALAAMEEGS